MIKQLIKIILFVSVLINKDQLYAQGNTCGQATPFCTGVGTPFVYPNVHNGSVAQTGPNYGCLGSEPDPSWFYLKTSSAGVMTFSLSQTVNANGTGGGLDVDYIAWGPFASQTGNCSSLGTNTVGCSFSAASTETLSINSPGAGWYYIIMITNYTGVTAAPGTAGYIAITQTSGPSTDCSITCPLDNFTLVGAVNATGVNIPNGSTVSCTDPFVIQPPRLPLSDPNHDILTPCIKVTYEPFTANLNTNGTVKAYEGGVLSWAVNCPTCTATVGGTVATAGNNYSIYYTQVDPAKQHDFSFCNGAGAIGTSTVTLKNCWSNAVIAGPTVWTGSTASCFTLTAPANTSVGTGTFSIAPATGSVGIVDYNWGLLYVDPSYLPGGQTYTVTYTFVGPSGCTPVHGTYTFSVPSVPVVSAIASQTVCSGATVNASNFTTTPAGGAYTWINSNTSIGVAANGTVNISSYTAPTVAVPTVGNFTVTPTQSGCIGTPKNFTITINPNPVANAGSTGTITCANTTTTLAGSGGGTYSWTGPGITAGNTTASPTINLPGTYSLVVTSTAGCTSTISTVAISQNTTTPVVTSAVSAVLNCTLSSVNASATTSTTPVTYAWTGPSITAGAATGTATVNQPGTYNYTVTNTANGCKTSGSVAVTQNTVAPTVAATPSGSLNCTTTTVQAIASTTATPVTYVWTGTGITAGATTASATVNQPGTFNYTVTNTSNGCVTSGNVSVIQNTVAPTVTSTVSAVLNCTLTTVNASATTTTTPVTYVWSGTGITSASNISTITVNQPGTFNYTVTNTSNGCTATGSQNVTQNINAPAVVSTASGSLNCTTTTVQTIATTTMTPVSYAWTGPSITAGATTGTATVNQPGTYNYTVTNTANGCKTSGSVAVIQNTVLPNANATTASIITCTNNTVSLSSSPVSGVTYTWTAPGGSSILSSINSATVNAQGAGIYTVTITDNSNNCVKIATVSPVSNTTVITPSITSTPILTCSSTTVTLNGAPTSGVLYGWTGPGTIPPVNLANVNINLPGSYVLTATNTANGCVGTITTSITQNTVVPTLTVSPTQTITCASPSVTISGASSPSTCTPSWAGVCGSTTSFTTAACATGTFVLTVTNPVNGCTNTGSVVVVSSNGLPSVTASNTGSITCSNSSVQVAATTTASPVTYSWSGPGSITSASTATTSVNAGGTYTCVVTNTNTGCASTITSFVPTNTTAVTVAIAPASSITCVSTTQTLSASPTGSQYTYSWTGAGIISGSLTANPEVNLGGNYVVTITNTVTGCTGTNTVNVPQDNAAPTITINPSSYTTTCANPTATLVTNASSSTLTYSWTAPSSGALDNLTTANPVASGSGIFTVAVTNTVNGCSTSLSQATVQVVPDAAIPTVTLSSNSLPITCSNPTPSISVSTSTSAVSYNWSPTTGIVSGATTASPTFSLAGSYSVVVTNTVNSCATSNSGNVVTVVSNTTEPVISLSGSGDTGTITCSSTSVVVNPTVTPGSDLTYTWSAGSGISTSVNQASATFTAAGVYTLAVTNTLTGCTSSTSTPSTFTVIANTNTPTVTLVPTSTNTTIGCGANTSVTFSANATSTGTTVTYSWNPGGIVTPSFTATTAGVYVVVVTDAVSNCSTTTQFTVTGNTTIPNLTSNATGSFPCGASNTTLTASSTNTNVTYLWTGPAGAVISGGATNTPTVDMSGNYVVTVTDPITNCTNSSTIAVSQTSISAAFTANPTSGIAPLAVNFTNQTQGAISYSWIFGDGNSSTSLNPSNTFTTNGTYTVILTASAGSCSDTASVIIIVEDGLSLEIPNVFTPNGDGINDLFTIKATGVKEISLSVFNRWGLKLYDFTGPKAAWDGNISNGAKASDGTYFFFVKATGYDDKVIEKNGTVNLFR